MTRSRQATAGRDARLASRWVAKLILLAAVLLVGAVALAERARFADRPAAPVAAARTATARHAPAPAVAAHARPVSVPAPVPASTSPADPAPAIDQRFMVKRVLDVPEPMHHGDWYWDDAGVPDGPIVITVDLAAQVLSAFRDGYEIGTAVVLYGGDAKPTPLGVYPITQKDAHHVSNIYSGAPMPYMLRLTNDGVSIHASPVADGYMTHGCIGVPLAFAKRLFGVAKLGDKVIVTRGKSLQMGQAITPN